MIHLATQLPHKCAVAVSGGIDSMALLDFMTRNPKRDITALHFNHGTSHADRFEEFVIDHCKKRDIKLITGKIEQVGHTEKFWRDERYKFYNIYNGPILLGHNLNDAVEWWIFTSMTGNPRLIPTERDNFLRPFLLTSRAQIEQYASERVIPHIEDPSNTDIRYTRNRIRHKVLPELLQVHSGLFTTIKNLYLKKKFIEESSDNQTNF